MTDLTNHDTQEIAFEQFFSTPKTEDCFNIYRFRRIDLE